MRMLFFILLLANATFFAYAWFGPGARAGGDAQIIGQQLNPERIRLLRPEQLSGLTRKPEPAKTVAVCLEWGAFSDTDVARAEQVLEPLALGAKLSQRRQDELAGFWVYIAPLASRQAAAQKAAELKRLGVEDYFIVPDDPKWRNAISLGIFKTEDAAKTRLGALREQGVKSAAIGARETPAGRTYFQVRDASSVVTAKLNQLKQAYAGTEVRECAPAEKKG
ncbi:MAG: SPOR domain-containing protein [Burkholderiales bacterium]|nr:SPOR domain-containing protein [Burkholderiales bacterium]